jgi:hypothetical protein
MRDWIARDIGATDIEQPCQTVGQGDHRSALAGLLQQAAPKRAILWRYAPRLPGPRG